jgi:hypothetical protein
MITCCCIIFIGIFLYENSLRSSHFFLHFSSFLSISFFTSNKYTQVIFFQVSQCFLMCFCMSGFHFFFEYLLNNYCSCAHLGLCVSRPPLPLSFGILHSPLLQFLVLHCHCLKLPSLLFMLC